MCIYLVYHQFSLISRFYFYFLYSPVYLRLGHVTESIGETGVCVADQPPAHGDHDLLTLIVSMTARNHQTDSYQPVHKSVQHVVCNQFNSSWGVLPLLSEVGVQSGCYWYIVFTMTGALESGEHQQIVTSVGSFQLLPTDGGHYLLLVLTEYLFCVVTFYSLFTDQI